MFHQFITRTQTVPPPISLFLVWGYDAGLNALYLWGTCLSQKSEICILV